MIPIQKIKEIIQGEVSSSESDLEKYSHDASVFEIMPQAVVHPKNVEDLKALVKMVSAEKSRDPSLSLTARSAGTDMSGGAINDSLILDFTTHFNKILDVSTADPILLDYKKLLKEHTGTGVANLNIAGLQHGDGSAVVQPGVFYRDFEKVALEQNLLLPCYTASKTINTLGGMAANNSAGEKSLSYGQTKDYVEYIRAVMSDGNEYMFHQLSDHELQEKMKLPNFEGQLYRKMYDLVKQNYGLIMGSKPTTSKNSSGYLLWEVWNKVYFNLAKLLVGSQGTLGLITEIKYKLVKPKKFSELLVIFMNESKELGDLIDVVLKYKPESFESFDNHTFNLAIKFMPEMIRHMKGNAFSLGLKFLPELWMALTGGMPKLILIAEFTGDNHAEIIPRIMSAKREMEARFKIKTHITKDAEESEKYWTVRRESFNLLRQHTTGRHTAPFIDDIVVHPHDLPQFLPRLDAILAKYPQLIYTIAGHMGDANFHIIPLMDLANPKEREIIPPLSEEVYKLVLEYKGSITAEHNDGLIRTPYLEKMYGASMVKLFTQVKQIFDPLNIFNPRKKVGGTIRYAMSHMRTK